MFRGEIIPPALFRWDIPHTVKGYGLFRDFCYFSKWVCVLALFKIALLHPAKDILLFVLPNTNGTGSSAFLLHKRLGSPTRIGNPTETGRCQEFLLRFIKKSVLEMKEKATSLQIIRTIL